MVPGADCVPAFTDAPRRKKRRRGIILPHIRLVLVDDVGLESTSSSCCSSAAVSPTPSDVDGSWLDSLVLEDFDVEPEVWKVLDEFSEEVKQLLAAEEAEQQQLQLQRTDSQDISVASRPRARKPRKKKDVVVSTLTDKQSV